MLPTAGIWPSAPIFTSALDPAAVNRMDGEREKEGRKLSPAAASNRRTEDLFLLLDPKVSILEQLLRKKTCTLRLANYTSHLSTIHLASSSFAHLPDLQKAPSSFLILIKCVLKLFFFYKNQ